MANSFRSRSRSPGSQLSKHPAIPQQPALFTISRARSPRSRNHRDRLPRKTSSTGGAAPSQARFPSRRRAFRAGHYRLRSRLRPRSLASGVSHRAATGSRARGMLADAHLAPAFHTTVSARRRQESAPHTGRSALSPRGSQRASQQGNNTKPRTASDRTYPSRRPRSHSATFRRSKIRQGHGRHRPRSGAKSFRHGFRRFSARGLAFNRRRQQIFSWHYGRTTWL